MELAQGGLGSSVMLDGHGPTRARHTKQLELEVERMHSFMPLNHALAQPLTPVDTFEGTMQVGVHGLH